MTESRHQDPSTPLRAPEDPLSRALRTVAEDDRALSASSGIEARLLAEALGIARARRWRNFAAAAVLAALTSAIAIPVSRLTSSRPSAPVASGSPEPAHGALGEETTEFFPLMYSNVPMTSGQTLRLELPQSSLTSFGLDPDDPSGTVLADVVVGQDGLARAVRFVRPFIATKEPR